MTTKEKSTDGAAFAVIQTGGKQYQVKKGDVLKIEKLSTETKAGEMPVVHEAGAKVVFDKVLLTDDGAKTTVGAPYIAGGKVTASVVVPVVEAGEALGFALGRHAEFLVARLLCDELEVDLASGGSDDEDGLCAVILAKDDERFEYGVGSGPE